MRHCAPFSLLLPLCSSSVLDQSAVSLADEALSTSGWTGVSEMFGDDRLLVTQVHEGLHDGVGVRHVQADLWQLVVHTLETPVHLVHGDEA